MSFKALRVDVDGTYKDLVFEGDLLSGLRVELGGDVDLSHYACVCGSGLCPIAVALVVREFSADNDPVNEAATRALFGILRDPLPYTLHGPVIFLGWDRGENEVTLHGAARHLLVICVESGGK